MSDIAPLPWDTLARYRLIEILALWEGRVASSQLGRAFDIGRQQAQKVLKQYRELAPGNLVYDESRKGFIPADDFSPSFSRGRVEEYLHLLGSDHQLDCPFAGLGLGAADTDAGFIEQAQANDLLVNVYTINGEDDMQMLLDWGRECPLQ
ncbi:MULTISPECIES: hypothetical protein [Halomonadaceae]|uniref:hypothetical protein n=1 Tax=Halomonadaceae TaxID=28256 RepID=UPI00159A8535|nr:MULTISPECIES: hypothetical protein [Halomonas]QJQ93887.1 hypothetical protein HIO72_00320 [Halomonas sp. PA5]